MNSQPSTAKAFDATTCRWTLLTILIISLAVICLSCSESKHKHLDAAAVAANNRGVALMGQFDYMAAYDVFETLAKDYPDHGDINVNLAVATLNRQEEGDEHRALAQLAKVLQHQPKNLRAYYCSGLLALHMGQIEKALAHFQNVVNADPNDMDAWYFIGKSLVQLSRHQEALVAFERSMAGDPYLQSAYYGAILALRNLGQREKAVALIKEFQRLKTNPQVRLLEFKYKKMGRRAEAIVINEPKIAAPAKPAGPVFAKLKPLIDPLDPPQWKNYPKDFLDRSGITVCDVNGDGFSDIFINAAFQLSDGSANALLIAGADGGSYRLDRGHPLARVTDLNAALWGDIDNDGLTDVYLCRRGPNQLWRQFAKNRWREVTAKTRSANSSFDTVDGALFDADHDGDLDIFLVNADGPNELLNNNRDGTFRPLAAKIGLTGNGQPSKSVSITDLDGDRDADIIVINTRPPHEIYINDRIWEYRPGEGFNTLAASNVSAAVTGDANADGQPEIYALNPIDGLTRWLKGANGVWTKAILHPGKEPDARFLLTATRLSLTDVDGDGIQDVIVSGPSGWWAAGVRDTNLISLFPVWESAPPPLAALAVMASERGPQLVGWSPGRHPFVWPAGSGRYSFAALKLSGRESPDDSWRSNASGIGARLSIRVGSQWTVVDTFRSDSGPGQSLQPVSVGTAGADHIDFVAVDWSDGVYQTELDLKANTHHDIIETQRQLSSCPVLFAWDGTGYTFVSDILGVGGMGYFVGPGQYAKPRPHESFMLPPGLPRARSGRLPIKLTEPMEEVTYLDAVRLTAYDLPPGWSMTLDERMAITGTVPTGLPLFYRVAMVPEHAVNDRGQDVTGSVTQRDLQAAPPGNLDRRFIGRLRQNHAITLTYPKALDSYPGQIFLVADGWVEYPYSQTNFAAWQAGADYRAPSIEVQGPDGGWQTVLHQFGYPAGMPRQMSVALPELPKGARKIRISSNQEIYWDRLAVAFAEPCPQAKRRVLALAAARLEQIGFPQRTDGAQRLPRYDYRRRQAVWDMRYLEGDYTRFGDVKKLVAVQDDAVAIFGPGEGLHLEFIDTREPLKPGWRRVYVIETNGWCKDMDLYTKNGETVGPIPRLAESSAEVERLHELYNTRYQFGRQ